MKNILLVKSLAWIILMSFVLPLTGTFFTENVVCAKEKEIIVLYNGNKIDYTTPPVMVDNRVLVPMRMTFKAFNRYIIWDEKTQTIKTEESYGQANIELQIGNKTLKKNDKIVKMDVAPQLINDTTYIPLRAVSEAFDADIKWNEKLNCVIILYGDPDGSLYGLKFYDDYPTILDFNALSFFNMKSSQNGNIKLFHYTANEDESMHGYLAVSRFKEKFFGYYLSNQGYDEYLDYTCNYFIRLKNNSSGKSLDYTIEIEPAVILYSKEKKIFAAESEVQAYPNNYSTKVPIENGIYYCNQAFLVKFLTDQPTAGILTSSSTQFEKIEVVGLSGEYSVFTDNELGRNVYGMKDPYKVSFTCKDKTFQFPADKFFEGLQNGMITTKKPDDVEFVNMYSLDFRIKKVPKNEVEENIKQGWFVDYPYWGKQYWAKHELIITLSKTKDRSFMPNNLDEWNLITFQWFDDNITEWNSDYTAPIKLVYFECNGRQYSFDVNNMQESNYNQWLREECPQITYGLSDEEWDKFRKGTIWVGMSKDLFLINHGEPYDETTQNGMNVLIYQYSNAIYFYYFKDDKYVYHTRVDWKS